MESWRFFWGAIIHAVIIGLAIVYTGERLNTSSGANGSAEPVSVKTAAAPINQPPTFLEGAELIEKVREPDQTDRVYGNSESPIKLISYFDVQCSFCRQFYSVAKRAIDESEGSVSWSLRHFPLNDQSPSAQWAKVPECIAEQKDSKGFFAFFDKIYLDEAPLNESVVSDLLSSLNVDKPTYDSCLYSQKISSRIERDIREGRSLGIQGTPTTVIYNASNGKAIFRMGAMSINDLRSLIGQVE
ncbi:thioredoxin domain-containing protein [Marinimicrobium sp. ABcell2]|uniref:DsbA family protein n=1 Tax=Marinimicrobium sp. ABcell2 TaxID=3069751 RepID=UPI0027B306CD|nr:thioredoxin domain-containing protein [Marinimicrobium sp. ABcell2]MDQ2075127.1 thioredoxin domain-containing protein [Marinimicrobium sp. ABcell2]